MTKATAALVREFDEPMSVEEVELEELQEEEILVRIKGVGICHTDISAIEGKIPIPLPSVLGHEGSGIVEAVGSAVTGFEKGDHVALSFDSCGECPPCEEGHRAYCVLFGAKNYFNTRLDGTTTMKQGDDEVYGNWFGQSSFGSYAISGVHNTVKVDRDVPIELVGPLGCGLQTGAGSVRNVLKAQEGKGIGIFGLGGVGLGAVMQAKVLGCNPIVAFDLNAERLELAKELGATHTYNPSEHKDLLWDFMQDHEPLAYTFDTVGNELVINQALSLLGSPGHCASVGFQGLENPITIDQGFLLLGRTLSGVIEGDADPSEFVPYMIDLYKQGKFPFDRLIKTFPIDQINEAVEASTSGKVIKPVIVFD